MSLYIIIAIILFILCLFEDQISQDVRVYSAVFVLLLVSFVLFDGLRWENGTDWDNYLKIFEMTNPDEDERFEFGYLAFNRLVYFFGGNYTIFLILHACILYGFLFYFLWRFSDAPFLSLFLFYSMFLPYQGMNRQFLSIAFCFYAFKFLIEGRNFIFAVVVLFACLFHTSAFIFLVSLLLRKQYSFKIYLFLLIGIVVIGLSGVVRMATDIAVNALPGHVGFLLEFYSEGENESASGFGLLLAIFRRLLWVIPILYLLYNDEELPYPIAVSFNLYFLGCLIYILFNGSLLQIFVSRGILYFMMLECMLIPYILLSFNGAFARLVLYNIVLLYAVANLYKGIHSYDIGEQNPFIPYKTIYYNTSVVKPTG